MNLPNLAALRQSNPMLAEALDAISDSIEYLAAQTGAVSQSKPQAPAAPGSVTVRGIAGGFAASLAPPPPANAQYHLEYSATPNFLNPASVALGPGITEWRGALGASKLYFRARTATLGTGASSGHVYHGTSAAPTAVTAGAVAAAAPSPATAAAPSGGGGGGFVPAGVTLQTNGTNNGSQTALNLVAGSNVTLTNSGTAVTVAASGGSGSGTIVPPDVAPSSAPAFNDEFTGSTVGSKWTTWNPGAVTLTLTALPSQSVVEIEDAGTAAWYCGMTQPIPTAPWTITAKVYTGGSPGNATGADSYTGIVVLPAAEGAIEAITIGKDSGDTAGSYSARWENWTNFSTFGTSRSKITLGGVQLLYVRFTWDGTTLTAYWAAAGMTFWAPISGISPSFTPGRVGIGVRAGAGSQPCLSYCDWIRQS